MNHHDILINQAVQDGWIRGHAWYTALARKAKADPFLWGEWYELKESIGCVEPPRPDAWRSLIESQGESRRPLLVVEFLEVEVTSGVGEAKDELCRYLWDVFDATAYYHLRIWHMDRFGVVRPYITTSTHHPMAFGMNAGRRS